MLADTRETTAVIFTAPSRRDRWVVSAAELAPDCAYLARSQASAELSPSYLVDVANRARSGGLGIVLAHTHPLDAGLPDFSSVDDAGEHRLLAFFKGRVPGPAHMAFVLAQNGARARHFGAGASVNIDIVGRNLVTLPGGKPATEPEISDIYDRQVRAFGVSGQRRIKGFAVAVVGLGGTGSVAAQELALLGASRFLLIDPDRLEITNRNRVLGAGHDDIGALKVDVAARAIRSINAEAEVEVLAGDILDAAVAARLPEVDVIFLCTDSHASRAAVAEIAYQHLMPTFDMGVAIKVEDGDVRQVTGRVQMLSPGLACLVCSGALDSGAIRLELMPDAHRKADPYFAGEGVPQPAVVSINATVSSLAVSMFLAAVTGLPLAARHQWYDGIAGTVRSIGAKPAPNCLVCSAHGALGQGSLRVPLNRGSGS